MRLCKICNSKMILRLSKKEPYMDKYFWGCSTFPICSIIENTILIKKDFRTYYLGNDSANSILSIKPYDILTDAERHYAICQHFEYDYSFNRDDLESLDLILGFEDRDELHFWIASQQIIVTHGVHNHLPVGSPYYFTFRNLTDSINKRFDNKISDILIEKKDLIEQSIAVWTEFFMRKSEASTHRQKISEEKIQADHQEAEKKKSEKASVNIFNAIRRKDIKAIEALKKKGADLTIKNEEGLTCIDYAKTFNDNHLIEVLTNNLPNEA